MKPSRARIRRPTAIVAGFAAALLVLGVIVIGFWKPITYAIAMKAAAAERWPEAFKGFLTIANTDPDYRDVGMRVEASAGKVQEMLPMGIGIRTEVELIRWLAESGEVAVLADTLDHCMVAIPAGSFIMGSEDADDDERPERSVYLDAFMIDRFEVTNAQYARYVRATGWRPPLYWSGDEYVMEGSDYPVVGVTWAEADAYCQWAGKRLPTEAEWEKSCRGTEARVYPWGNAWKPWRANLGLSHVEEWPASLEEIRSDHEAPGRSSSQPGLGLLPVGSYMDGASPYGVLDLVGNVSEWVLDRYNWEGYGNLPDTNPVRLEPKWNHVLRGTAWFDWRGLEAAVLSQSRCSTRNSSHSGGDLRIGFRCAK